MHIFYANLAVWFSYHVSVICTDFAEFEYKTESDGHRWFWANVQGYEQVVTSYAMEFPMTKRFGKKSQSS